MAAAAALRRCGSAALMLFAGLIALGAARFATVFGLGAAHFATVFAGRTTFPWYAASWARHMRAMMEGMANGVAGASPGPGFGAGHTCFGAVAVPFAGFGKCLYCCCLVLGDCA